MKSLLLKLSLVALMIVGFSTLYATNSSEIIVQKKKGIVVAETFKVYGGCDVCKKNIETAVLSHKGVKSAEWDKESMVIEVIFNNGKVTLDDIKKALADAGYDTGKFRATDEKYKSVHTCCTSERPSAK